MATIKASYLHWIARYAAGRGVDTGPFLLALGLSDGDGERRVAIEQLFALWEQVARALSDPGLPLGYAECLRVEDHHVLGFAVMSAPTGLDAVRTLVRFAALNSDSGSWSFVDDENLVWQRAGQRTLGMRLTNEAVLCEVLVALRQILPGFQLRSVSFRHPAPADLRAHRRFFAVPMHWAAEQDALSFERAQLARVPATENPSLMAYFAREAERRAAELAPASVAAQVARMLATELADGGPTPAAIAKRLALSASGLREQLQREGTNFRTLLDTTRRERADELLRAGGRSISEIALLIGFSETSAFTRAYTRWHGVPPRQHRSRS